MARKRKTEGLEEQVLNKTILKANSETNKDGELPRFINRELIREFVQSLGDEIEEEANLSFKDGKYPKWMDLLLEHDANPMDHMSDKEFADMLGIKTSKLYHARRAYPNYALAVAYRQKKFMAELGNLAMKKLVEKVDKGNEKMIITALEMTGKYTPTNKVINSDPTQDEMKLELKSILEQIKKDNPNLNGTTGPTSIS